MFAAHLHNDNHINKHLCKAKWAVLLLPRINLPCKCGTNFISHIFRMYSVFHLNISACSSRLARFASASAFEFEFEFIMVVIGRTVNWVRFWLELWL